jgi:hypothetical protein
MTINQFSPPNNPAPVAQPQAVVVPKRSAHGFHLTMTILTFGVWVPVWIVAAILNAGKTKTEWVNT